MMLRLTFVTTLREEQKTRPHQIGMEGLSEVFGTENKSIFDDTQEARTTFIIKRL